MGCRKGTHFWEKTPGIPAAIANSTLHILTGKKILPPDFSPGLQAKPLFSR
jgi:hypothetical protein